MELLNVHEAAVMLRVHTRTLQAWRKIGFGPVGTKVGARVFYRPEDIDAFIQTEYHAAELDWAARRAAWVASLPEAECAPRDDR